MQSVGARAIFKRARSFLASVQILSKRANVCASASAQFSSERERAINIFMFCNRFFCLLIFFSYLRESPHRRVLGRALLHFVCLMEADENFVLIA